MTNQELLKIIAIEQIKNEQANNDTKAKELESLWNELADAKLQSPAEIDTWVKANGGKLAKFGLDANDDIDKILTKSDKEIYGKIPELQDKDYLDNLDKFSLAKLRSDARKNGFPSVQDYIQTAYKFKADREFMKSFEPDPNAGKLEKAREWITKNFYPNAYEAIKNQPVYGTSSNNKILKSYIADQILNAAAIGSAPIGGLFSQMLLGGGNALASELAGKYHSNKDIDPLQVGLGAGLGAFGGRVAGKSGGDVIKGAAARLGLTRQGDNVGKVIYGLGDALEGAAINPKSEVAMARKASKKWLGPTWDEMKDINTARITNDPKLTAARKAEELKQLDAFVKEVGPNARRVETSKKIEGADELFKEWLADPKKYAEQLQKNAASMPVNSRKDYWRQSLKNQLPTDENVKLHKDILSYSDPEFNAFKLDLPLSELDKPIIALEGQTGIPFRKAWAEPKFSSSLRTMLQGASQLGARKSREMDDDDTESIYNAILKNKPEDVKNYNSGLENNLTPYEKDIVQKFYIRK